MVPETTGLQDQLVHDSVHVLNLDWEVGSLPGDSVQQSLLPSTVPKRSRSIQSKLFGKATAVVDKTRSVLGKRGAEAMEKGKGTLQTLGKRTSLRSREPKQKAAEVLVPGEPAKKKTRLSDIAVVEPEPEKTKATLRPKRKHFLEQGLYVGQMPDFDPRLSEAKNKRKAGSLETTFMKQNKVLPVPMFGGKRVLDHGKGFRLPFNVFSPLPPGQPKPEEWRKTQKSELARNLIVIYTDMDRCVRWRCCRFLEDV